ncbi:MAG: hypothetical protein ACXV3S_03555 [Kineosporiaceae bacterium]
MISEAADPSSHPLGRVLREAAEGVFPPVDGGVDAVPPYLDGVEAVVSFPRGGYAREWRRHVRLHADGRGLVTLSRGLGGQLELSFEVWPGLRGRGHGRALLRDALALAPPGEPVFAAVAPGNAASLRALLAAAFVPIGSVQLVRPGPGRC